jgi:hypothetical protein
MTTAPADGSLDAFFERLHSVNPFLENRVNGYATTNCDADAVHLHGLTRLTDLAAQALAARRGLGVVVWGEAGIGKSHLLARLGRWAATDHHAAFVYLHNLQATPEHLPRALLRHVVGVLTHGRRNHFHLTPLFALIHAGVAEAVGERERPPSWGAVRQRFNAFVDRLTHNDYPSAAGSDRSIYDVLFHFFHSAYRARLRQEDGGHADLAVRWLAGQSLELPEARALGLPAPARRDDPIALEDAQQIKQVLVALSRLAASYEQPFILAFDQVDNLDNDQFAALSRFLEALLDSAPNLLIVTSGVRASLERWREIGVVQQSAWERLGQFEIALQRLNVDQAAQLIRVRLDNFLTPFAGLETVQRRRDVDAFFPLGTDWFDRHFHDKNDLRPRDVVNWAREGWREQQEAMQQFGGVDWLALRGTGGSPGLQSAGEPPVPRKELTEEQRREAIDRLIDQRIAELVAQPATSANLPADAEHLAGLLIALLSHCRDDASFGVVKVESVLQVNGRMPTHTLNIVQQFGRDEPLTTGVLVLTMTKATSVTAALRRLAMKPLSVQRFVLVTEARIGLPLGAGGRSNLDKVERQYAPHFHRVQLAVEEYAYLQALQTVVREARSRDLEIAGLPAETRTVREAEVIASHHRRGRYRAARVLAELLASRPEPVAVAR